MRAVHEVSRALRRAADAAELRHALGLHSHLIHRVNDAFGNRVMPATRTERRLPAPIVDHLQSYAVNLRSRRSCSRSVSRCVSHVTRPPSLQVRRLRERASMGNPWIWQIEPQPRRQFRLVNDGIRSAGQTDDRRWHALSSDFLHLGRWRVRRRNGGRAGPDTADGRRSPSLRRMERTDQFRMAAACRNRRMVPDGSQLPP